MYETIKAFFILFNRSDLKVLDLAGPLSIGLDYAQIKLLYYLVMFRQSNIFSSEEKADNNTASDCAGIMEGPIYNPVSFFRNSYFN